MINWFDMPAEGLSNGGQFEVKELEVTENGTYEEKGEMYNKVTVNVEGGGSSWQTVFEGSVTTHDDDGEIFGTIENLTLNGNSIRITFNGAVYELPKTEHGYGAENDSGIDFSTYPLFIATGGGLDSCTLWTLTAGTYTLKIEEPQSGGSSDFSKIQVTLSGIWNDKKGKFDNVNYNIGYDGNAVVFDTIGFRMPPTIQAKEPLVTSFLLKKDSDFTVYIESKPNLVYEVTGDAEATTVEVDEEGTTINAVRIFGDCKVEIQPDYL